MSKTLPLGRLFFVIVLLNTAAVLIGADTDPSPAKRPRIAYGKSEAGHRFPLDPADDSAYERRCRRGDKLSYNSRSAEQIRIIEKRDRKINKIKQEALRTRNELIERFQNEPTTLEEKLNAEQARLEKGIIAVVQEFEGRINAARDVPADNNCDTADGFDESRIQAHCPVCDTSVPFAEYTNHERTSPHKRNLKAKAAAKKSRDESDN